MSADSPTKKPAMRQVLMHGFAWAFGQSVGGLLVQLVAPKDTALAGRPVHRRVLECRIGHYRQVTDDIIGEGCHLVESFRHFHPSFRLEERDDGWIAACQESGLHFRVTATGAAAERKTSTYCPRFGARHDMLVSRSEAVLPARQIHMIEKL